MPPRFKKRNTPAKRKYAAKKRLYRKARNQQSKRITTAAYVHKPLSNNGMPNQLTTKLNYTAAYTLTCSGSGALATNYYTLNGLFDPDIAIGGHQPYLFDQLKNMYTTYLVYGCYVHLKMTPITSSQNMITTAIRANQNSTAVPSDLGHIKEIGHACFINIQSQDKPRTYKGYKSISKLIGVQFQSYLTDPDYKTVPGSNPTNQPFLSITYGSADGTSTPSFYLELSLTYYTKFQTLVYQAQS